MKILGHDDRFDRDGNWVDTLEECVWRTMVYWQFCKRDTWTALKKGLGGDICWNKFNFATYADVLTRRKNEGHKLYTGGYQIHPEKR